MKFKRQSRGHITHDGRSNVDSSPQRSVDDDDDDDDESVDERRRVHGTSTVTSRSGSPAVDSTTTDYCSVTGGDVRTPADRSNEPSLLSSQQTSLENDEPLVHCSDKALRQNVFSQDEHELVVSVSDQPAATDRSANNTDQVSVTSAQTSVDAAADTANMTPSETQSNLARLEIMTCIAGGNVDHCQNMEGLQSPRPRRGHAGALSRSSRLTASRCDGRRARAVQSRSRSIALMAGYGASGGATCDVSAVSDYRRGSVFNGESFDKNYISDFWRQSRDVARDLESTLAFPGSAYSDTARCLYTDFTADDLIMSDGYPSNAVTAAFQQQQQPFESYGALSDSRFQSSVIGRPSTPPALHCNMTAVCSDSDNLKPLPHPPMHSAASFPVCDAAWKDSRWNNCASFPANAVDYDDDNLLVGGEHLNWKRSVDTCGWTNGGHDYGNDVIRTSFFPGQSMGATRRSQLAGYWNGDCSTGYPCTSNYVMPYYDVSGRAGSRSGRAANYCSVPGVSPTESSRFYDGECCYAPASTSLCSAAAADGQSAYQSCKYSGVVDGHCRLYTADSTPAFVNTT